MPDILNCNDSPKGKRLTDRECGEIYNALADRCRALRESIDVPELPERARASLVQSLADCERLVEVFE